MKRIVQRVLNSASRTQQMITVAVVTATISSMPAMGVQGSTLSPKAMTDITRYCQTCWKNAHLPQDVWADCTQEVFTRLLQNIQVEKWQDIFKKETGERQEFLRAIDTVKKRTQRSKRYQPLSTDYADRWRFESKERNEIFEEIEHIASKSLSSRQREIVLLSRAGHSIPEIAAKLSISEARVSDEKYKAIRKIRASLPDKLL